MSTRKIKRYGWKPDLPDHRDHIYSAPLQVIRVLPHSTDLRPGCPPVYDQGELGSCTANAIGALDQFVMMKEDPTKAFMPSRLFIYLNERVIEGTVSEDSGAQIRDGIKSVASQGVCPETEWPYDISKFADTPPPQCYNDAKAHLAIQYSRVTQSLTQLKSCLASGYPFVFGFTVYESFESDAVASTGMMPMPGPTEEMLGGHAIMAAGYDDSKQCFLIRNSWGPGWGVGGYFWMPYAYITSRSLSSDFWTIRKVVE